MSTEREGAEITLEMMGDILEQRIISALMDRLSLRLTVRQHTQSTLTLRAELVDTRTDRQVMSSEVPLSIVPDQWRVPRLASTFSQ
jgi:hypothetical protein